MSLFLRNNPSATNHPSIEPCLSNVVLDCWDQWDLGRKPDDLSLIRRSSVWLGREGKVVYLFFRKGEERPTVIAKTVRSRQYSAAIHKEATNTRMVWEISALRPSVPRPLDVVTINGLSVYFEEACPGVGFPEKVRGCWWMKSKKRLLRETIDAVARWLESFHRVFIAEPRKLSANEVEEHWLAPLLTFAERYGPFSKTEQAFLDECTKAAYSLIERRIALPPVHGDLWGGSVLWGLNGGMYIIDWEFFKTHGLPMQDLINFAIHPGFALRGKENDGLLAEFKNLFYENVFVSTIRGQLQKQAMAIGLESTDIIKMLIGVVLVRLSLERDNIRSGSGSNPTWVDLWLYFVKNHRTCGLIL